MTTDEFKATVVEWMKTARHPKYGRPYNQCIYQPMLEVLTYLRANGFKTFIVSGSGVVKFELKNGKPVLIKEPKAEFIDDGPGKPVGINRFIGRRPVMAFGNSDGDLQMLQGTTAEPGPRFALIVHHTDGEREVAYDRQSHIGRLDKALDQAWSRGWTVVSMKDDWKAIFPSPDAGARTAGSRATEREAGRRK
jgi:hypothetical protein